MACRVFAAGVVAVLLMCAPVMAMEKDARASEQVWAVEWLSELWSDLGAWLDGMAADGGCWIDPNGGCSHGAPAPPADSVEGDTDGGCWIDPGGSAHCG